MSANYLVAVPLHCLVTTLKYNGSTMPMIIITLHTFSKLSITRPHYAKMLSECEHIGEVYTSHVLAFGHFGEMLTAIDISGDILYRRCLNGFPRWWITISRRFHNKELTTTISASAFQCSFILYWGWYFRQRHSLSRHALLRRRDKHTAFAAQVLGKVLKLIERCWLPPRDAVKCLCWVDYARLFQFSRAAVFAIYFDAALCWLPT